MNIDDLVQHTKDAMLEKQARIPEIDLARRVVPVEDMGRIRLAFKKGDQGYASSRVLSMPEHPEE